MADPATKNYRRAYQAVLDRTPPAPEWDELGMPARRRAPRRPSVPRWLVAAAAALLLLVVLGGAAMLGLGGEPEAPTPASAPAAGSPLATAAPPTAVADFVAVDPPSVALTPRIVAASSELGGHEARYLVDGTPRAWNDESRRGEGAVLTFSFSDPHMIEAIVIHNLDDAGRFARNFRIARLAVWVDGAEVLQADLPDEPGPHRVATGRRAATLAIHVLATHPAEAFGGSPPFEELAVAEVEFLGRPAR